LHASVLARELAPKVRLSAIMVMVVYGNFPDKENLNREE